MAVRFWPVRGMASTKPRWSGSYGMVGHLASSQWRRTDTLTNSRVLRSRPGCRTSVPSHSSYWQQANWYQETGSQGYSSLVAKSRLFTLNSYIRGFLLWHEKIDTKYRWDKTRYLRCYTRTCISAFLSSVKLRLDWTQIGKSIVQQFFYVDVVKSPLKVASFSANTRWALHCTSVYLYYPNHTQLLQSITHVPHLSLYPLFKANCWKNLHIYRRACSLSDKSYNLNREQNYFRS